MSDGQDGYGKFFKQARRASGRSMDSASANKKTRHQFSVKPERESARGVKSMRPSSTRSRIDDSSSTRDSDIEDFLPACYDG